MLPSVRAWLLIGAVGLAVLAGCRHGGGQPPTVDPEEQVRTVEEHWPDGQLRRRAEVADGPDGTPINHGLFVEWHNDGVKAYEATYVRGKLHGVETQWHRNGQKYVEQHYVHGQRHGPRYVWDDQGRKRKEEHYFEDQPDGTWTEWRSDGRVKWQGHFERGRPVVAYY